MNLLRTKWLVFFYVLTLFPFSTFSQGEFNNWYFGKHAGVCFNSGTPVALTNCSPLFYCQHTTASVSDSSGNLMFYADYIDVFNGNHTIMPNGNGLSSSIQVSQPVIPVPKIHFDSTYFLFTMDRSPSSLYPTPNGLRYSEIDMRLDGGSGDIVMNKKNIPVPGASQTSMTLSGIRHQNNKDVWIVVRKYTNENQFLSYLISKDGIDTVPVPSNSLVSVTLPLFNLSNDAVMLKISPDGTKLICLYDTVAELCSFNNLTGVITPLFCFKTQSNFVNYVRGSAEFSIDSRFLYITLCNSFHATIWQYDATKTDSTNFKQSEYLIYSSPYSAMNIHIGLQIGPDNKIYCSEESNDSISVINYPNIQGTGCNFQKNILCLESTNLSYWGFPQFLQKYKAYIHHSGLCQNDSIHFSGDIWPPADSIHWDFGDPSSGGMNSSNLATPSHTYANPGTYTVELFVRHIDMRTDTSWQTITILASPQVALGPDRTICNGDSVTFDAGFCSGCTYLWKDLGSGLLVGTSQTFKTGLAGNYSVTVTRSGCSGIDTVQLITTPVPIITNNQLTNSICSGESTNIPLTSNVAGTNFHWTATLTSGTVTGFSADSGLLINQILTNPISTPGVVTYHVTPKIGSCAGDTVDFLVTVNPGDSVKVSITASGNNVCAGTSITYTAFPINPGLTPVYHWKVNGINSGTNSSTFSYTPVDTDVVTCELTSSLTVCISNNPAMSNGITMTVNPNLPVSVTVTPTLNPVCAGTSVTFTAHPVNEGTLPSYQWKVNGNPMGANLPTYTYIPLTGDGVTCTVNSNATCAVNSPATSPVVTMTVNPNLLVSVTIISSSNPFCAGSSVTFTATPNHGGITPSYQWKVNGINAGTNSNTFTYNPVNNDQVNCILTSSEPCTSNNPASSISLLMVENTNLPAAVSIAPSSNPFCPGSPVTFLATPINGGTPVFLWKVNGINAGTNSNTYSYNPVDGDSVRCIMTSNLACVTGNPASSAKIIMSGTLAPAVTFTSCYDTITTVNAKPIRLRGGIPLGGTYSGPGVNSVTSVFTPSSAGTGVKTIIYSYTNAALCAATKSRNITVQPAPVFSCGNNLTDIRDSRTYATIQIGTQCWMAENLNYGIEIPVTQDQRDNCIPEYFRNASRVTRNAYYQWDELMLYAESPADQGFCPPGWHIPSENDWNTLFAYYISSAFAGSPLKYSGYSGFNALLSGTRHANNSWDFSGFATFFWSSTPYSSTKSWSHGMNEQDPSVSAYPASRMDAFSVRCLKD
jgi:uncharacterized protein (TIGR02145 family)